MSMDTAVVADAAAEAFSVTALQKWLKCIFVETDVYAASFTTVGIAGQGMLNFVSSYLQASSQFMTK